MMVPRVVDISHHNVVTDLKATAMSGVWGVIHKASQGKGYRDPDYSSRRQQAKAAGLLWGAYHFNDGTDVAAQVDWFIKCAQPDENTLMVLDFEDNPKSNMNIQQAVQFLRLLEQKTGRKGAIYSGNRLKETIHSLNASDRAYLTSHRLWLCQYGPRAVMPIGFTEYWLWQYTGDGIGPQPHGVPGINGSGIDLNAFDGDKAKLVAEWSPGSSFTALASRIDDIDVSTSSHARQAEADEADSTEPPSSPQNVRPQTAAYSLDVEILQRKLDRLGYHDVGDMDGKWGGKTKGAIVAFLNDRGVPAGEVTGITPAITDAISTALTEGWTRPISDKRANATAKDIAPKVEAVRQSLWQRLVAKVTGASAGGVAVVTGVGSQFGAVNDKLSPVKDFFANIPGWAWFTLIAAAALALWLSSNKATISTTQDYNTGKIN
jgi:GH25 family lysozyme M1 (1,4-beta-N-acetylmuramidase)